MKMVKQRIGVMVLMLLSLDACRGLRDSSSLDDADQLSEWVLLGNDSMLGEGHRFRMSPVDEPSKCLLPGRKGLVSQPCGTAGIWHVKKIIDADAGSHVKVIQSLHDYSCAAYKKYGDRYIVVSASCDESNKDQWLILQNSRLNKASFDGHANTLPGNIPAINIYVAPRTADQAAEVWRDYIIEGNMHFPKAGDKTEGSERSNIYWGRVPALKSFGVAFHEKVALTGIQMNFANGSSDIFGSCKLASSGCELNNKDHPEYANPYIFQAKEYISKIQVKFSIPTREIKTTYLTEIQVFVKNGETEKLALWKGKADSSVPWKSIDMAVGSDEVEPRLSKIPDRVIAGLLINTGRLGHSDYVGGIGGIFVERKAYEAHNPEQFAPPGSDDQTSPEIVEGGSDVIGITLANTRITAMPDKRVEDLFTNQSYKFSSAFFNNSMIGPQAIGLIRLCGDEKLDGIFVRPRTVSGDLPAESYGQTNCPKPALLELAADEYITSIWWKPWPKASTTLKGPAIGSLSVNTNKGDGRVWFEGSGLKGEGQWIKGFGRDGYAIIGFHGVANVEGTPNYVKYFRVNGIINLGPWYGKISSLNTTPDP